MLPHILFTMFSIPNAINKISDNWIPEWKAFADCMLIIVEVNLGLILYSQSDTDGRFWLKIQNMSVILLTRLFYMHYFWMTPKWNFVFNNHMWYSVWERLAKKKKKYPTLKILYKYIMCFLWRKTKPSHL